jgi:hypothetical protein
MCHLLGILGAGTGNSVTGNTFYVNSTRLVTQEINGASGNTATPNSVVRP